MVTKDEYIKKFSK